MFINNAESIPSSKTYKCNGVVYNYLKNKIPLLSNDDEWYYFSKTEELKMVLDNAPFYIKVVSNWKF